MDEVDERLVFDNADGNDFHQGQQRQAEMIVSKLTQLPDHDVQVPHSERLNEQQQQQMNMYYGGLYFIYLL